MVLRAFKWKATSTIQSSSSFPSWTRTTTSTNCKNYSQNNFSTEIFFWSSLQEGTKLLHKSKENSWQSVYMIVPKLSSPKKRRRGRGSTAFPNPAAGRLTSPIVSAQVLPAHSLTPTQGHCERSRGEGESGKKNSLSNTQLLRLSSISSDNTTFFWNYL